MATISFDNINKIFAGDCAAVSDFNLEVADGELLVLVGPSGCGKSTLLRMVAGLEAVSAGDILIDGDRVNDQPPQQRNIAMVFQNYALYPHMTVAQNLLFPLRMRGLAKGDMARRLSEVAQLLRLDELLGRRPRELSGGQRQRVAMGRAIIREPRVFLMDEPLSNLDAKLRVQIRTEIAALQERLQTTTLYVTHDQVEAMTLGHRVAVMSNGRLHQVATARDLYQSPANIFVAGFIGNPGMNIFKTNLVADKDGALALNWGDNKLRLPPELIRRLDLHHHYQSVSFAGLRPEAFCAPGQATAQIVVQITGVEALGHEQLAYFQAAVETVDSDSYGAGGAPVQRGHMVARLSQGMEVEAGERLNLGIDLQQLSFFTASGEALGAG